MRGAEVCRAGTVWSTLVRGQRIFMSGMGGELASLTATMLEREAWVGELKGLDVDPPRRRLRRATFHRVDPMATERIAGIVADFDPHLILHLGVYEPGARAGDTDAQDWTMATLDGVMSGAGPSLEHIVVRSGVTIYGAAGRRGAAPDEATPTDPNSRFGRMLDAVETRAADVGRAAGVPVGAVRLAPVIGPHVPSPLGRLLRLPAVPFAPFSRSDFSVIWDHDAATALVAAVRCHLPGPVNVAAVGSVTPLGAIRIGRRIPLPLVGPQWSLARMVTGALGAPIPEHVLELLHHGRLADTSACADLLGIVPVASTRDVIDRLYTWPSVVRHIFNEAA